MLVDDKTKDVVVESERTCLFRIVNFDGYVASMTLPTIPMINVIEDGSRNFCELIIPMSFEAKHFSVGTQIITLVLDLTNDPTPEFAGETISLGYYNFRVVLRQGVIKCLNPLTIKARRLGLKRDDDGVFLKFTRPIRQVVL